MKIRSVDVIALQIPFEDGSAGTGLMPTKWTKLDVALVRVETEDGVVGWGDGFAYSCRRATIAAIEDMVAPLESFRIRLNRRDFQIDRILIQDPCWRRRPA